MPKSEKMLLAICLALTAACLYLGVELQGTNRLVKQMGAVINCSSALSCYETMVSTGDLPPGCLEVFALIDPDECMRLFEGPEALDGY